MSFSDKLVKGEVLTRDNFKLPPKELGILPFWFWNGELDPGEMEWQLREYKSKGIPGVFLHGRFGLKVPYVSDEWFERVRIAVDLAKKVGIDMWVYDEMNWPSGTAERNVLKKYPHLKQRYLELVALQVDGPLFTFLEATDSRYVNTGDSHPIAAFACTEDEFRNGITNLIDLTPNLSFDKVIPWEAPPGKWRLLYFLEKEVPYYIDALDPESTEKFIELTHERYKQAVGDDFGTVVPGFYTDEPAMHYYQVGIDNYVVPWSKQMFKIFRQRRGYDLRQFLPALYMSMGEKTARIRYDFWRTLSEQYTDTYYKRLRRWCEENGVLFTGHLLFEEWLRLQARCEGNIFKHLEQMHITGVDHLYPKIGTEEEPDQHVALKLASSAAHHHGSTRLLCESMGGTYWDCTLERMKWMTNWEYVLGVNLFNNHGYHYSIEGERKRDWPPSQFYQHTWWKYYGQYTTYANRLSHILSGGRHVAKLLIVYPLTSMWANYLPQTRTEIGNAVEFDFNYLTDTLLRLHYDFDYVDEDILAGAELGNGTIRIRDEEYSALLIPPMTHMKRTTFDTVQRYRKNGGTIIALTLLPVEFMETEESSTAKEVKKLFGVDPNTILDRYQNGKNVVPKLVRNTRAGKTYFLQSDGLHRSKPKQLLKKILNEAVVPDVTISDEEIFYLHRIKDNHDIYFLVNTSQQEKRNVRITFEQVGKPELWNTNTGDISPIHMFDVRDGRLCITLDFPASESHIVVLNGAVRKPYVVESNMVVDGFDGKTVSGYSGERKRVSAKIRTGKGMKRISKAAKPALRPISTGKEFAFGLDDDNVLCISKWQMSVGEGDGYEAGYHISEYDDSGWLSVTLGAWEMQLPQERDHATYPVTLWYRTAFEVKRLPENTRLLIDGFSGRSHRLFINGQEVLDKGRRSKLDAEIREVDIQPYMSVGRNTVAVQLIVTKRTDGILDLLKIVGNFALEESADGYVIVEKPGSIRVGDWTKQGYPFYSGTGVYTTEMNIPNKYLGGKLFLEIDCGEDVAEVIVNGRESIVQPWHPYRIDITDHVQTGKNTLQIRITNTLINILEAVQKESGLFSVPKIHYEHRYSFPLK
jgi:hypothetical protein